MSVKGIRMCAVATVMATAELQVEHPEEDRFTVAQVVKALARHIEEGAERMGVNEVVIGARYAYEAGWLLDVRPLDFSDMAAWTPVGRPTWKGVVEVGEFIAEIENREALGGLAVAVHHIAHDRATGHSGELGRN